MLSDHGEELGGAHLEGNGDVLIRIDHDHVVLVMRGGEPGSAVIRGHGDVGGLIEVFAGQIGDLLVNLHAGDVHFRIILLQLAGVGAGAHAEDQRGIGIVGERRRSQGRVVVHTCQSFVFHRDGLHAEQHVGGQDRAVGEVLDLQVVVDGLALIGQVGFPEREAGQGRDAGRGHEDHGADHAGDALGLDRDEVDQRTCRRRIR